jgi:hypothetical protein
MRWSVYLVSLVSVSGCGRFGFDATVEKDGSAATDGFIDGAGPMLDGGASVDALRPSHDEDGDGVADADDNCPWIANSTQINGDGDALGDECDPSNTLRHSMTFYSLQAGVSPFSSSSVGWVANNDYWSFDVRTAGTSPGTLTITTPVQKTSQQPHSRSPYCRVQLVKQTSDMAKFSRMERCFLK